MSYSLPTSFGAEVGNVVWKKWRRREIPGHVAGELLRDFHRYPVQTFTSRALITAAWDLAERYDRSFYDSVYLALAVNAECPLVTADLKLYNRLKAGPLAESLVWFETLMTEPIPDVLIETLYYLKFADPCNLTIGR